MIDALEKLVEDHPNQARAVKLRYFAGTNNEEIGEFMGISVSIVKNYWVLARACLFDQISSR